MDWSPEVSGFTDSTMIIDKKDFPTKIGELAQADLNFYIENPRVYTAIYDAGDNPDQKTIQDHMCELPHVQKLKRDIVYHEGLLEAIIVRDKYFDVLEGNSRLAAYRLLKGKRKYQKIRCIVLPSDIHDNYIFAYLGLVHINGKTPWAAHEKARYLQRETGKRGSLSTLSKQIGLTPTEGKKMVDSIELMQKYRDTKHDNFSWYMAYRSNSAAQNATKEFPKLESIVISEIKRGAFKKATEFRDALTPVCKDRTALQKVLNRKLDLDDALDFVHEKGSYTEAGKKIKVAKQAISKIDRDHLKELKTPQLNKVQQDLKAIKRETDSLLKIIVSIKDQELADD